MENVWFFPKIYGYSYIYIYVYIYIYIMVPYEKIVVFCGKFMLWPGPALSPPRFQHKNH